MFLVDIDNQNQVAQECPVNKKELCSNNLNMTSIEILKRKF